MAAIGAEEGEDEAKAEAKGEEDPTELEDAHKEFGGIELGLGRSQVHDDFGFVVNLTSQSLSSCRAEGL